jgi:hypothetical protein
MGLTNKHAGKKILAKIKIYVLTRAELLFKVCYEIPCILIRLMSFKQDTLKFLQNILEKAFLCRNLDKIRIKYLQIFKMMLGTPFRVSDSTGYFFK